MDLQKLCRKLMDKDRVERIEAEKQPKGLSAKTIRNIMQIISSAMDFAVAQKIITENPCKAVELPKEEKQEINGNSFFQSGDEFPQKSDVVITYHAKKMVTIPVSPSYYKGKNYIAVGDELQEMGFSEIYERPIRDLTTGWIVKDGSVEKVIVGEDESFSKNSTYEYDVKIVIAYHTFKKK